MANKRTIRRADNKIQWYIEELVTIPLRAKKNEPKEIKEWKIYKVFYSKQQCEEFLELLG